MRRSFLLFLLVSIVSPAAAQSAEELFQQAWRAERVAANPEAAIALYRQVVELPGAERELVARAWLQMGKAYEVLGQDRAVGAYTRVVRDYADLGEVSREAALRMAGLSNARRAASPAAPLSRSVVDVTADLEEWGAALSPSGGFIAGISYDPPGVRYFEVQSGTESHIPVHAGDAEGYGEFPRFSPDESEIALAWYRGAAQDSVSSLYVLNRSTGKHEVLLNLRDYYRNRDGTLVRRGGVQVHDWTEKGLLISAHGTQDETSSNCCNGWFQELLLVPRDGSQPQLVGGRNLMDAFAWERACLTSTGRYAFGDFADGPAPDRREFIARIDLETGEHLEWRASPGVDHTLFGCSGTDTVVYSAEGLGTQLVKSAPADALDGSGDRIITRLQEGSYPGLASKSGDLVVWESYGNRGLYELEVDPESGLVSDQGKLVVDRWLYDLSYSPSGDRLAWIDHVDREGVTLWSGHDQPLEVLPVGQSVSGLQWVSEDFLGLWSSRQSDADSSWVQGWDALGMTVSSHQVHERFSAELANELGRRSRGGGDAETVITWSPENRCFYTHQVITGEEQLFRCFGSSIYGPTDVHPTGAVIFPTLSLEQYLFLGHRPDGKVDIGRLSRDGQSLDILHTDDMSAGIIRRLWSLKNGDVLIGRGESWRDIDQVQRFRPGADTPLTEMYRDVFGQFRVRHMSVHPDGDRIAVFGFSHSSADDLNYATVIHNVLGEGGRD